MESYSDYIWLIVGILWVLMQLMRRGRRRDQPKPTQPARQAPRPRMSRQFSKPQIGRPQQVPPSGKAPPPIVPR